MASKEEKEIKDQLSLALEEIGEIKPWFSHKYKSWIFSNYLYPVEYSGDSEEEVIQNYPLYLREFIKHRLENRLSPLMERKTKGHGGIRRGAGRPKGSKKEPHVRVSLPKEIAEWLKTPGTLACIQGMLHTYKSNLNHKSR